MLNRKVTKEEIIKIAYIFISFLLAMPFVFYIVQNKTIYKFRAAYTYFATSPVNKTELIVNGVIFLAIFFMLGLLYYFILKNINKFFKNGKKILIFTFIISIIFMLIIPVTSLDVYSYIASGWINSNYNQNPYYTSAGEILNEYGPDEMLQKVATCWKNEPAIYGPLWCLICKILTSLSFGNINIALLNFKLANLLAHMLITIFILKISKKKFFAALYGLNPLILFETLSNVHNDVFLVLFVVLAIYFIVKKKKLWVSILFIALATAIKYLTVLLLPFIIIYGLKDEKIKTRIIKAILYFIEFIAVIIGLYLMYLKDINVFFGIFLQQTKYSRSIFLGLWYIFNRK